MALARWALTNTTRNGNSTDPRAGRRSETTERQLFRHSETPRDATPLRPAPGNGRGTPFLGSPQGSIAGSCREATCRSNRRPPRRLWWVRGVIPKGNYGAGKVIVWDHGTYEMVDPATSEAGWKKGKFHFILKGRKLAGEWVLVRTRREERQWIFFKVRDSAASESDVTVDRPESVVSGRTVEQIGDGGASARHWHADVERELEAGGSRRSVAQDSSRNFTHARHAIRAAVRR